MALITLRTQGLPPMLVAEERAYKCVTSCLGVHDSELRVGILAALQELFEAQGECIRALSSLTAVRRSWQETPEMYEAACKVAQDAITRADAANQELLLILSS